MDYSHKMDTNAFIQTESNVKAYETSIFLTKSRLLMEFYGGSDRKVVVDMVGCDAVRRFLIDLVLQAKIEGVIDD